ILISFISQLKNTNKVIFCSDFVFNNFKKNLLPLNLKKISIIENGLSGATEGAISVLRIDDLLWAKVEPGHPDWNEEEVTD
ncbi:MAG: hypothetical protein VXZ65_01435, partial [Candidatus Thermoplasmatota archaeon]|nr:hypothetical protein [Candidatus Thermoplasmatota archaeon]